MVVPLADSAPLTDWLGLGIGFVTALATALAAGAAWRAAKASERTSREAREALVAALEPALEMELVDFGDQPGPLRLWLRVTNLDRLASATDLGMTVRFIDGRDVSAQRPVLRPFAGGDDWLTALREMTDEWPSPEGEHVTVRVAYSDAQGVGRHELIRRACIARDSIDVDGDEATTKRRIK